MITHKNRQYLLYIAARHKFISLTIYYLILFNAFININLNLLNLVNILLHLNLAVILLSISRYMVYHLDILKKIIAMKKIILSVCSLFLLVAAVNAQTIHVGARAGLNLNKIDGQAFKDGYNAGFHLGGYVEIPLGNAIGIQPELLFNQTNTKYHNSSDPVLQLKDGENINLNYLSIPVLLNINAAKILTIQVGPQYSILMNKHSTVWENSKDAFKGGDFALAAGLKVNLGALQVYGRYNVGLTNISDVTNSSSWKSQQLALGIGLRIL